MYIYIYIYVELFEATETDRRGPALISVEEGRGEDTANPPTNIVPTKNNT